MIASLGMQLSQTEPIWATQYQLIGSLRAKGEESTPKRRSRVRFIAATQRQDEPISWAVFQLRANEFFGSIRRMGAFGVSVLSERDRNESEHWSCAR